MYIPVVFLNLPSISLSEVDGGDGVQLTIFSFIFRLVRLIFHFSRLLFLTIFYICEIGYEKAGLA